MNIFKNKLKIVDQSSTKGIKKNLKKKEHTMQCANTPLVWSRQAAKPATTITIHKKKREENQMCQCSFSLSDPVSDSRIPVRTEHNIINKICYNIYSAHHIYIYTYATQHMLDTYLKVGPHLPLRSAYMCMHVLVVVVVFFFLISFFHTFFCLLFILFFKFLS